MIARLWHGITPADRAAEFATYIAETGARDARGTPGNLGVLVLRRDDGPHAGFLFQSFWESWDAIRRFAGEDVERARYSARDREFLVRLEPHVGHYEVLDLAGPDLAAHVARMLKPLG